MYAGGSQRRLDDIGQHKATVQGKTLRQPMIAALSILAKLFMVEAADVFLQ
jgi:hypothetical protein